MALDFSVLTRKPTIADSYSTGQQEARQEAEQNMLRQMQIEQMAAQRDQRLAVTAERQAKTESASRRQQFLNGLSAKMAEGGYKLDRATLGQMLNYGMQSGEESLIKLAADGMKALDEDDLYRNETARLGMAPNAASSVMRQPAAGLPAAPAAPTNMMAGTPFDIGGAAPAAPANALAAPAGVTREMVQNMLTSPSPRIREQGKALAQTLPKESAKATLANRYKPVGRLVFDTETGQYIEPPASAIAATQERGAAAPAPAKEPVAKPLTAVQEAARRDKLGKEYKATTSALQTTQDVLDSIASVKSSPGLSRATGFSGTMLPSFPEGQAAQAETRLANLKGKVTALGKAAAAASGAIGSIANQEWKILADQIANIDPVKGIGPLLEQIDLVEAQALGAMERIRDSYGRQFGEDFERFPQFGNLPQPKSTQRKPAGAAPPAVASGNFTAPPPAAIDALKKGQGTDAQFDELFGPGSAARARGR